MSKNAVTRLLCHLRLSPQRPIFTSYKQDPEKITRYITESFPEAVSQAKKMGDAISFVDEASVRSDAHRGLSWGKIGETPVVRNSGGRFNFNVISARPQTGFF